MIDGPEVALFFHTTIPLSSTTKNLKSYTKENIWVPTRSSLGQNHCHIKFQNYLTQNLYM